MFGLLGPVEVRCPAAHRSRCRRPCVPCSPGSRSTRDGSSPSTPSPTRSGASDLPADAANALQVRVSKLRRALVAAGVPGDVLLTRAPGYLLAVEPDAIDVHRFEHLLTRARQLVADGNPGDALAVMDEALALWRGPAVGDVGDGEWIEAESARLEEMRISALEDRLELLLELGRHGEAVADLERLATLHPLRERLHRLLMIALYRGGRQADALTLYHRLRSRLADELGIDPSPELRALAEAILRQQLPQPAAPTPIAPQLVADDAPSPAPARTVPRTTPPPARACPR